MRAEVIQPIERRRSWPTELKLKILLEALQPGTTIAATADRHGVARGLVYTWMRAAREGRLPGLSLSDPRQPLDDTPPAFAAVRVDDALPPAGAVAPTAAAPSLRSRPPPQLPTQSPPQPQLPAPSRRRMSAVEVTLPNGRVVKVDEGIDANALARLVAALDGPTDGAHS